LETLATWGGKLFVAMAAATALIVMFMAAMIANSMLSGFSLYLAQAELHRLEDLERALAVTHDARKPGWPELHSAPEPWHDFIRANHQPTGRAATAGSCPQRLA
jgi:hypothetical protein